MVLASPIGGPRRKDEENPRGGAERIRTAVRGFAGPCLTTRPPRRSHHGTAAPRRVWRSVPLRLSRCCVTSSLGEFAGLTSERQNGWQPDDANLVPGLMPRRSAGAPAPYRGSALSQTRALSETSYATTRSSSDTSRRFAARGQQGRNWDRSRFDPRKHPTPC
jgi:hypothetical protein